jgi:hypothetical protein
MVHTARVPAYYALILRSLTVLEGLALQADANYKLLGRAYPYIARRLLTDPAPELRASFEDLVIKVGCTAGSRSHACSGHLLRHGCVCLLGDCQITLRTWPSFICLIMGCACLLLLLLLLLWLCRTTSCAGTVWRT